MISNKVALGVCLTVAGVLFLSIFYKAGKAETPQPVQSVSSSVTDQVMQLPKDTYFLDFRTSGAYGQYLNVITIKLNSVDHAGDIRIASKAEFTFRDSNGKALLTVRNS